MLKEFFKKKENHPSLFLEELLKADLNIEKLRDFVFSKNINLNFQDKNLDSYLHICLKKSKYKSAIWLIHNNIDLKLKDQNGDTAFDIALEIHNHQIVEELLKTDEFNIDEKDKNNRSILQDMIILGDNKMAELLINNGADVNLKDNHNRNVIYDAVSYGNEGFIDFLLSKGGLELNNIDDNGNSIMHHSQVKNNDKIAEKLILAGADTTIKDKNGETYLCNTALRGMDGYNLVDTALKYGANINSRVINNNTILMELVTTSSKLTQDEKSRRDSLLEVSKKLLTNGIDINAIDDNGDTALFRAVKVEDVDLVSFLLSAGVDPNIKNKYQQTVLHEAIYQGVKSLDIVLLLLKYNANPLVKNNHNETMYEILNNIILYTHNKKELTDKFVQSKIKKDGQYMVILKELLQNNKEDLNFIDSTGNPLFFNPLLNDHFQLFKLYIKNGLDIHNTNNENHNIFFEYVLTVFENNDEDIDFQNNISMLLSSKLDHNYQDETGWTIIHKLLTTNCNLNLFDILTQVVLFDYELTDKLGRSVIHNAVWGDKPTIMKRIHSIDRSIVNIPDKYGILPITYAALLGSQDLVLLFISMGSNVKSGLEISDSAIEKFKPMLKNLSKLTENIVDVDTLKNINMVVDQVKRDFNLI